MSEHAIVVYESQTFEPSTSWALVLGLDLALVGALAFCLRSTGRARRAAQHARASIVPGAPLVEGQRFVAGTVALASDEPLAVEVTVTQQGSEHTVKNGKVHEFKEIDRTIEARPFYLVHESGERVRVEPPTPGGVRLIDRLDQEEWIVKPSRRKRAALTEGEAAYVEGQLERGHDPEGGAAAGYREAAMGWVLRPRRGLVHVSTEPLAHRHELRLRALERVFLVLLLGFVAVQAPLGTFWLRALAGRDVDVPYRGKHLYSTQDSKGRRTLHEVADYALEVKGAEPVARTAEVSHDTYAALPTEPGTIALRRVAHADLADALGRGPSLGVVSYLLGLVMGGLLVHGLYRVLTHKRWYERPLVDTGLQGPLPAPPGTRFVRDGGAQVEGKRGRKRASA